MIGIYKITSPSNKIYIGQSIDILRRKSEHEKYQTNILLRRSVKKYGWNKHKFEVLQICNKDELNDLEKYYVNLYDSFNSKFGMNLMDGGGSCGNRSDSTKQRMSLSKLGKPCNWNKGSNQYSRGYKRTSPFTKSESFLIKQKNRQDAYTLYRQIKKIIRVLSGKRKASEETKCRMRISQRNRRLKKN